MLRLSRPDILVRSPAQARNPDHSGKAGQTGGSRTPPSRVIPAITQKTATRSPTNQSVDQGSGSLWVHEKGLVPPLNTFLTQHVFGPYRQRLLDSGLRRLDMTVQQEREQRVDTLRRQIADVEARN